MSPDLFQKTKQLSKDLGVKFQVHTAEDQDVVTKTAAMYDGMRNVEFFDSLGILDEDTQLAHAIWLDDHEMEILEQRRCQPIHCPVANAYLADGVARVPEMLKMGLPVALGTDGPGSNNAQDMLGTLKYTALMHKNHNLDAHIISNKDVLTMATRNGAIAMGMGDQMESVVCPRHEGRYHPGGLEEAPHRPGPLSGVRPGEQRQRQRRGHRHGQRRDRGAQQEVH